MRRPLRLRSAALAAVLVAAAGPPPRFVVQPGSRFWIDGTSTMGAYTCTATRAAGSGTAEGPGRVAAEVAVPVRAFDCGQGRMNRDFYRALRAGDHPDIRIAVTHVEADAVPTTGAWTRARATGTIRLAGVERPVVLQAEGQRQADGRLRVRGRHPFRMSDFGVTPPVGLLGLVRAHDGVVVRFDLVAGPG